MIFTLSAASQSGSQNCSGADPQFWRYCCAAALAAYGGLGPRVNASCMYTDGLLQVQLHCDPSGDVMMLVLKGACSIIFGQVLVVIVIWTGVCDIFWVGAC